MRRRVNGLSERFMANNYTRYGERLKELVQQFVTEPLCTEHYELDVQWSILQFLLDISTNPVAALAENKEKIRTEDSINGEDSSNGDQLNDTMNDLLNSLMQHNISVNSNQSNSPLHPDKSDLSVSLNEFSGEINLEYKIPNKKNRIGLMRIATMNMEFRMRTSIFPPG